MAELILTEKERAATLWTEMDDATLGKLLRKKMAFLNGAAEQLERSVVTAAAMLLVGDALDNGAVTSKIDLEGFTQGGEEKGNWRVTVEKIEG